MDPGMVVLAAGFQQEHAIGGIAAETVGEKAACRPRADDDVVELIRPP